LVLILGFVEVADPLPVRHAVLNLQRRVVASSYFQKKPYIDRMAIALHAKDDLPEVRYLMFELISSLDICAQVVVARKVEGIFLAKDQGNQNHFYDYVVSCLFEKVLHLHKDNYIYFAHRGSRSRQLPLTAAINNGIERFKQWSGSPEPTNVMVQAQRPSGEPCLSVIDYVNWGVYQAYVHRDMRFFNTIRSKVSVVADLFDEAKRPKHWYNRRDNPFDIEKTTPL